MLTVEEIKANHFEIKIRGWGGESMEYSNSILSSMLDCMRGDNLMLWTGDKDADGKDIYCKDIVISVDQFSSDLLNDKTPYIVLISNRSYSYQTGFDLFSPDGEISNFYGGFQGADYKVIGNIYENPELWPVTAK